MMPLLCRFIHRNDVVQSTLEFDTITTGKGKNCIKMVISTTSFQALLLRIANPYSGFMEPDPEATIVDMQTESGSKINSATAKRKQKQNPRHSPVFVDLKFEWKCIPVLSPTHDLRAKNCSLGPVKDRKTAFFMRFAFDFLWDFSRFKFRYADTELWNRPSIHLDNLVSQDIVCKLWKVKQVFTEDELISL